MVILKVMQTLGSRESAPTNNRKFTSDKRQQAQGKSAGARSRARVRGRAFAGAHSRARVRGHGFAGAGSRARAQPTALV